MRNTNLLRRAATLDINPEARNIYQQTNQSDGEEFNLQMSAQNLQKQLNLRLKESAQQHQFGDCLLLPLLLATRHCFMVGVQKDRENIATQCSLLV